MSGGAAHVKFSNRGAIARPAGDRPQEEKLLERKFTLKNIAFGQAGLTLDIERCNHLLAEDDFFQIWRVLGNCVYHGIAERVALLVPSAVAQFVRRVLYETRKDMFSGRRDGGIREGGN